MSFFTVDTSGALAASYTGTPAQITGLDDSQKRNMAKYKLSVTTAAWFAQGIADTPALGLASNDTFTTQTAHKLATARPVQVVALGDTAVSKAFQVTAAGPTFLDLTAAANNATVTDTQPFPVGEVANDYFAVGYTNNFGGIKAVIATAGTVGTLVWEYWNGAAWTALSGVTDNTTQFKAAAGTYTVVWTVPSDWAPQVLGGSASLYYIRAKVTGAYTVDPVLTQVWVDGVLPTGISAATTYWPIVLTTTTFKLATSRANAIAGIAIDLTTVSGGIYMTTVAVAGTGNGSALLPVGVLDDIDGINGAVISVVQDAANGKASLKPVQDW